MLVTLIRISLLEGVKRSRVAGPFEGATGGPSRCDPRRPLPAPVPAFVFARSLADRGSILQTESHLAAGRRPHARGAPRSEHSEPTPPDSRKIAPADFF